MTYREIYAERNTWKPLAASSVIERLDQRESVPFDHRSRSNKGNARYAQQMGVDPKAVARAGGAQYLKCLEPHIQRLLLGISS
jgi:hypothetical protein